MMSMNKSILINPYHNSLLKRIFDIVISLLLIICLFPVIIIIGLIIKLSSQSPVLFIQKRTGKKGRVFKFIKFRTMRVGAKDHQRSLRHLNEADGPVFKIRDDPRFTKIGKLLARTGLDELPQLINVIKGEMSLVGPRPLPVAEARKLNQNQKIRELISPGMTSSWVIKGNHSMKFKKWMWLDEQYVLEASLLGDIEILFETLLGFVKTAN